MTYTKANLFLVAFLFINFIALSQSGKGTKIYETYDDLVTLENTGFYNGKEFIDPFLNTDGTYRYFNLPAFVKGVIVYNNQFHANVSLKYDLYEDIVIARSDDDLKVFNVKLIPERISKFSIYNHHFVRLTDTKLNIDGNGFFEIGNLGNVLSLYIKHIKKRSGKAINKSMQYRFVEDNFYLLLYNNSYHIIYSIRDLRKIIPERKKQINDFYKSYKPLYKSDPDSFMIKLIKYLDGVIGNSK